MSKIDAEHELKRMIESVMDSLPLVESHAFGSQRTTADWIEHEIRSRLIRLGQGFRPPGGPRRPGDVTWNHYHINIKSTDLTKDFHMPNLISSENLWKLLERGDEFVLLRLIHRDGKIEDWDFWNIQDISWDCLQIGALGTGQIQIKNATKPLTTGDDRPSWRQQWQSKMMDFYQREQTKIGKRLAKWSNR